MPGERGFTIDPPVQPDPRLAELPYIAAPAAGTGTMTAQEQAQLDGDRDYCNPPFWWLREEGEVLLLRPRSRPPAGLVLVIGAMGLAVVAGVLVLAQAALTAAAAALGAAAIGCLYALYFLKSGGGPWLRVDRSARRIDLPRAGGQIRFEDVVEVQKVIGFNRRPERPMARIAELNLVCRMADGRIRKWPLVGGIPGGMDSDGIDGCAVRLAEAIGTEVRTYEVE